jgi:hypothetical protein
MSLTKSPQFLLRSARTSAWWCTRKLEDAKVLSLYGIRDTVALALTQKLRSNIIGVKHLTLVKIILSA